MTTALTVYFTNTQGTTLSTTNQLSMTHGTDNVNVTQLYSLLGTATGWGEICAQGTTNAWAAAGSIGSPSGNGFMLESATLNLANNAIIGGSWTANVRLCVGHTSGAQTGTLGSNNAIHVRIYRYRSGVYTQIIDMALNSQTINSTLTTYALSGSTSSATTFLAGDLLYVDIWVNVGANANGDGALNIRLNRESTNNTGDTNAEVVTPGYTASSTKSTPLRTVVRSALQRSLALRTLVSTAVTKSMPLRTVVYQAKSVVLRTVLSLSTTKSVPLRTSVSTANNIVAVPLRTVVIDSHLVAVPSQTIVDLHYQKQQQVQVFDPYGNFLTIWPDTPHITGLKDTVNAAQGQIRMVLPRTVDNFDAFGHPGTAVSLALMNGVKIYVFGPGLPQAGLLKFNGFIDAIEPAVTDAQQQSVTVTLTPWSSVFGDHGFGGSHQFNNTDPIAIFKYWFDNTDSITHAKYTYPMTWAAGNPTSSGKTVNYLIQQQDLKSIADAVLTMLGTGWYWRPNPDNTVTLAQVAATAKHQFHLGQHFASLSYSFDNTQRKNVVYFTGNTQSVKGISTGASALPADQGGIGERLLQEQDSRITDNTSAKVISDGLLSIHDVSQVRAKFRVVDYRGNTSGGLGYDIESLKVGDAMIIRNSRGQVTAQSPGTTIFDRVLPIASIDYNWSYADIEAGILAPSQSRRLFVLQRKFKDFTLGAT